MIPIHVDNTPKLKSIDEFLIEDKEKGDYRLLAAHLPIKTYSI